VIVVAGEALVDLVARPDGSLAAVPGGGPYTLARAIGRLGVPVAWAGCLSDDRFGRLLEAGLREADVSLDLVQRTMLPTTLAVAELDGDGAATYRFYSEGTAAPALAEAPLVAGLPAPVQALAVGTLGLVLEPLATTVEALAAALPADALLFVDPNCRPSIIDAPDAFRARLERVLRRADIVKVSVEDLAFLHPRMAALDAARRIAGLGTSAVVITDGPGPVRVLVDGTVGELRVPAVPVVDTVGAGDIFGGALLACLLEGRGGRARRGRLDRAWILRATAFGARAAAVSCTRVGADPPRLGELGGWPVA
jgi:fructokinase